MAAETCNILLICPRSSSTLFEQIAVRAAPQVSAFVATSEQEFHQLAPYLQQGHFACAIVDWEVDFLLPELLPKSFQRYAAHPCTWLAIVHSTEELLKAYTVGYDFALEATFSRATYYTVTGILRLVQAAWAAEQQRQQMSDRLASANTTIENLIHLAERMIALRIPESPMVSRFARSSGRWIAEQLAATSPTYGIDLEQLELAARLYAIGRLALSDAHIHKPISVDGIPSSQAATMVPHHAGATLEHLVEFPETRLILLSMYENYDGTGFPNRIQGWQIPIGARILRVVVDYAEFIYRDGYTETEAISRIQQLSPRLYDQRIVLLLDEYLARFSPSPSTVALRVESLAPGMVLARDIITTSGHKLATAGTQLEESHLHRILTHHALDPVLGNVYVLRRSVTHSTSDPEVEAQRRCASTTHSQRSNPNEKSHHGGDHDCPS